MKTLCFLAILAFTPFTKAVTFTYSNTQTGVNLVPLGYEVPVPVDSLTPIDGFRTYESLDLRHQQLAGQSALFNRVQIGQTYNGRPIWAYQLSDGDNLTISGANEGAALINGGIHAREWQSPEALTGYMERLSDESEDQHIAQYLLENLNLVLIPVLNVDGFLQTQRFPTQVTSSQQQPRDGRMRRKNMREVDEDLATLGDNLQGIDLNRNNAPYWATNSDRSSDDVDSIVHHGSGPASEPETQALLQAAQVADESRLRFYIDTHSFSQIYFTPSTNNNRRNEITQQFAYVMRAANGFKYEYGPSASGGGIGATDEHFANTYQIPAYTLEIEPSNSATTYGGFGVSHDGFILPNSEVARMRNETASATLSGLYATTEIPILMAIEIWDANQNALVLAQHWQTQNTQRTIQTTQNGELQSATDYQLKLIFNKPMRQVDGTQAVSFSSLSQPIGIDLKLVSQNSEWPLDTSTGSWLVEAGFRQYKTDTFIVNFNLDSSFDWQTLSLLALEVSTPDMVGQQLDTNPATVVDWQNGAWINYEDTVGNPDSDLGGLDMSMRLLDDGSDLYAPVVVPPPIIPPPDNSTSGGGSLYWLLVLLVVRVRRFDKA
jgi:murein tripeptide amidase MpaA